MIYNNYYYSFTLSGTSNTLVKYNKYCTQVTIALKNSIDIFSLSVHPKQLYQRFGLTLIHKLNSNT